MSPLKHYYDILKGKKKPKFQVLKENNLLDKKIKDGFKILESCQLCERKCKVDRLKNELGFCGTSNKIEICSYFEHYGEESFFVPSFTIFFCGCVFSCQYCQNWTTSQRMEKGAILGEKQIAKIIDNHQHCKNVNFVGGDPIPYLPFILKTLKFVKINIPIVWNSNFFMGEKSMNLLKDVVDVYLSDFKYGNNGCALRLSKVKDYFKIVSRNHLLAFKDSSLVIRHLVLPNHFECCSKVILDFIAKNFGDKVIVNIMDQYRPEFKAREYEDIKLPLKEQEFNRVVRYAGELGLNFIT